MLRVHFCVSCGDPLPTKRRVDRRYCLPSCRSVASRARKREREAASKDAAGAAPEAASSVRQEAVSYGSIPREVLDILAKHFGQRDEVVSAELRMAQRRIAELQSAIDRTEAQQRNTEASNLPLAEAQERIRKLTEAWQSERTEAADKYDKLATKYETLLRQSRVGIDESAKRDENLETTQTELQAARDRLAQAEAKIGLQASELEDLKRIVAEQKRREGETEAYASEAAQTRTELLSKQEDAERRARQVEDRSAEQIRRLQHLEAQLGAAEKLGQEARDRAAAWAKEGQSAQQQVAALKTRIAEAETASSERLAAARREREQLLAELSLHREQSSREAEDDAYEPPARQGIEMIQTLVTQSPDERRLLRDHMQRFRLLIEWAARWFVRQFSKSLLSSDAQVQVDAWATKAVMDLRAASARSPGLFPMGLPEWAETNSMLLGQLALSVAGSASLRIQAAVPEQFRPAPQTASVPRVVQGRAVPLNPVQPPVSARRLSRELEQPPTAAPVSQPVRAPAAGLPAPPRVVDAGPKPPTAVPPLSWPEQFKQDRLAAIKQDLLSISNQLAEEQDIQGRTITAQRLRAGVSIGEQALEEAMTERWAYIRNSPPGRTAPVAWVRHGVVLDDESERALRARATEQLVELEARLRVMKRRRT